MQGRVLAKCLPVAAVVASLIWHRDVAISLVVLAGAFIVFERAAPISVRSWRQREGNITTECVYFLCGEMLAAPLVVAALVVARAGRIAVPDLIHEAVGNQPYALAFFTACVVGELGAYAGHWLLHNVEWLWRFHKVHHSIRTMDWLAPSRHHPVDLAVLRITVAAPLVLLGFAVPAIGAPFVLRRIPGLFVHANTRVRYGNRLRWVITSPEFHHWHHSADPRHHNKNYAGTFPVVDWIFGTLHFGDATSGYWPRHYGLADATPRTWLAQLWWPFQRARRAPVECEALSLAATS